MAHDMEMVFDHDKVAISVPKDARWVAVAAGYEGFITASDTRNKELAMWRAHRACETEEMAQSCSEFESFEFASKPSVAVAYCADGHYNPIAGIGIAENEERARAAAIQKAESLITWDETGIADDELSESADDSERDPGTVVVVCRSVLLQFVQ